MSYLIFNFVSSELLSIKIKVEPFQLEKLVPAPDDWEQPPQTCFTSFPKHLS